MILASLKSSSEVFSRNWLPAVWKWENYKTVWTDTTVSLLRSFVNSIVIVVLGTGGQIIISSLSAYAFAKVNFKGKNIVFTLFLASMMIPVQATIIPRFILFYEIGLYNNLWSLILPSWFGVTSIFLLRQFYMGLPTDLMDAAKVDGAGHLRIFWQIMMPLTKPAMVSSAVLSFITIWNDYLSALIFLVNKKTYTVALAVRYWLFDDAQRYELTMASAASTIIPVVILFIFCQKYFVEGIATSGVKG
ncbi:MAG: carbohydrate ABC transporter permease [Oscillospiraceae bacterium]|nr:carbohydrate ABC transporter permease [Oscillospiraceae bacterium]MDE6997825.1 carbohydrate ABC transporter permease [Oscillospiraceae bacterium]